MTLSEKQKTQLNGEISRARRAKQAYDVYVKEHVAIVVDKIYASIEACSIADVDTLKELKGLLIAIRSLESSILSDIDTGKMAEATLENENG